MALSVSKLLSAKDFFNMLSPATQKAIAAISEKEWRTFTKKMIECRLKRAATVTVRAL